MPDRKDAPTTLAGRSPVKGIVHRRATLTDIATERFLSGQDLQPWVEYFWTVDWELGVSPKQVLSRFRQQEAAWQLERQPGLEIADLAVRLGWYDQANFSRDFRPLLGETPARYAARARAG